MLLSIKHAEIRDSVAVVSHSRLYAGSLRVVKLLSESGGTSSLHSPVVASAVKLLAVGVVRFCYLTFAGAWSAVRRITQERVCLSAGQ